MPEEVVPTPAKVNVFVETPAKYDPLISNFVVDNPVILMISKFLTSCGLSAKSKYLPDPSFDG